MTHEPVMLQEVLEILKNYFSGNYNLQVLDGTLGAGGYSEAILREFENSNLIGLDRDELAIKLSNERLKNFDARFKSVHGNFGDIKNFISDKKFNALVFDLGVSNMQITIPERGFSFQNDGPLDMRMNNSVNSMTASDVLYNFSEKELEKIFRDYGEERYSKLIASGIKKYNKRIESTFELVNLIREILPQPVQRKMGTHPARRIFQALRIFVNDETSELEKMLNHIPEISDNQNGAVIIIVSYHSLEDRIVKNTFKKWRIENSGKIITKHPLTPSIKEIENNYKSRSAKLRAFFLIKD